MHPKIKILVIFRFLIGAIFLVSGFEKLTSHYQNFLYVIQGYEILPGFLENIAARIVPWIELFVGIFVFLGLGLTWSLRGALILFVSFIIMVAQAIVRQLPINECGCFGELFSFPLPAVLIMDSILFLMTIFLIVRKDISTCLSLDHYFSKKDG